MQGGGYLIVTREKLMVSEQLKAEIHPSIGILIIS